MGPCEDWSKVRHRLKFVVGGVTAGSNWFDAAELVTHVTLLDEAPDSKFLEAVQMLDRASVVVVPTHPVDRHLPNIVLGAAHIRYLTSFHNHYIINIDGSFADYIASLPRKHRQEIKRKRRRFQKESDGAVELTVHRTPEEVAAFYDVARQVSSLTYQERLLDVGLPDTDEFRSVMMSGAARDEVRAYLLNFRGTPIAYGYCSGAGGRLDYEYTGYDQAYGWLSPGNVLLYEMLESLTAEGSIKAVSLGSGEAQYKRAFANDVRPCVTAFFFPKSLANLLLCWGHLTCATLDTAVAKGLDRIGLKQWLKSVMVRAYARRSSS